MRTLGICCGQHVTLTWIPKRPVYLVVPAQEELPDKVLQAYQDHSAAQKAQALCFSAKDLHEYCQGFAFPHIRCGLSKMPIGAELGHVMNPYSHPSRGKAEICVQIVPVVKRTGAFFLATCPVTYRHQ